MNFGKFPPLGQRGFNTRTRAGLWLDAPSRVVRAGQCAHILFVQIETKQAVGNLGEICRVAGLSGILIGPGDLSASLGVPGDFKNPELINIIIGCIHTARVGRHARGCRYFAGAAARCRAAGGARPCFLRGRCCESDRALSPDHRDASRRRRRFVIHSPLLANRTGYVVGK